MFRSSKLFVIALIVAAVIWVGYWLLFHDTQNLEPTLSFDGRSNGLNETVIVPTLDTPIPPGKSAIWCASFQIAWNQLKDKVAEGPVQVENAQPIADRLNASNVSGNDLPHGSYYANAGWIENDIVATIQRDMQQRFPNVPKPSFEIPQGSGNLIAVANAYLESMMNFDLPFIDDEGGMAFKDSSNRTTRVAAFGIPSRAHSIPAEVRRQVTVLYRPPGNEHDWDPDMSEFIIDPSGTNSAVRMIFAAIAAQPTLGEMVSDVQEKTTLGAKSTGIGNSAMLIPNMDWRVQHRFAELVGHDKRLHNPILKSRDAFVAGADQLIRFKLNKKGVELRSEAIVNLAKSAEPQRYYFARPYLITFQAKNAEHPFFVMWVANAELLVPRR